MNRADRVISVLLILAVAAACYLVWLDRGELDLMHSRLDGIDNQLKAMERSNSKPKAQRRTSP